jgi:hypothetical protein
MSILGNVEKLFAPVNVDDERSLRSTLAKFKEKALKYHDKCHEQCGYIFRGELDFDFPLLCSLERHLLNRKSSCTISAGGLRADEERILHTFKRAARPIAERIDAISGQTSPLKHAQPKEDTFWWLALMQHYKKPTRLIDFTTNIDIALFFAVEHFFDEGNGERGEKDLVIYCFPCKDLAQDHDEDNNKAPQRFEGDKVDMNWFLKEQIAAGNREPQLEKFKQLFGWDRPHYQNPRLEVQKGMFVYPYGYRDSLTGEGDSWLVQNLSARPQDPFNFGTSQACEFPPVRIVIPWSLAPRLKRILVDEKNLASGIVYLDFERVAINS